MKVPSPMRKRIASFLSFALCLLHDKLEINCLAKLGSRTRNRGLYIGVLHIQQETGNLHEFRLYPTDEKNN